MLLGMTISELGSAVFIGNAMTAALLWGCVQFHRHDYRAPWVAYAAFLFPIGMALADLWLSGSSPLSLAASASQR